MIDSNFLAQLLNPSFLLKMIQLLILILYIAFAFVIINQVKTMNKIVYVPSSSQILIMASIIHFILAVSLFLTALVIL